MRLDERFPIIFKILLPLLILVLLQVSPVSRAPADDLYRARIAHEEGQYQAAVVALRRVAERQPWRLDLWEQIGQAEYAAGRPEEAASALRKAQALEALSADGRFLLGEVYYQQRDYPAAEAAWLDALQAGGPSARVYERLARMQSDQQDYPAAAATMRAWQAAFQKDARAAFFLGLHLTILAPEEALPFLLQAAELDPGYQGPVQALRRGLAQAGIAEQPAYGWLMIGRALGSIGQWALAEEAFHSAITLAPEYAEAWAFLGEARSHTGGSGNPELERARAINPESTVVNALYSLSLRRQGKYQDALAYLQDVALQEPGEPLWLVEIGNTLVEQGDLIAARKYFEQSTAVAPNNSQYWQTLARFSVQYSVDVRGLGLPAARRAVILAPEDPAALDTLGWTLANLGDHKTAERFLQQALEHDAGYPSASLHLGQIYLQQQNSADAYFYLTVAAGQNRDRSTAEIASRLLRQYFSEDR